jgi:outer membrane protein OmpA-like peptidoglycan-associated protein
MKIFSFVLVLLFQLPARSQDLLANGGFEVENVCTEYHVKCAPEAWICTAPSYYFYFMGPEVAHQGKFFMGIVAGHSTRPYKRTFIRTRLVCSLQKDHHYTVSFFIRSPHAILDSAGIYFTAYDFLFEKRPFQTIVPAVYLATAASKPVKKDTGWQQVAIDYTATGEENFFTIGYFAKNDLKGSTGIDKENNFLFFIDDFSMLPADSAEQICPSWQANIDTIYAQNERHEYLDREIRLYRNNPPPLQRFDSTGIPVAHIAAPRIDTLLIPDILFASGKTDLTSNSHPLLDSFCTALAKRNFDSLKIEGHTDSIGTLEYNKKLSAGRARAVAEYIYDRVTMTEEQLLVYYYAYTRPLASNATAVGRQKNRRVVILVYHHN